MSRVIGFRLDRDNPREAQALAVLEAWQEAGYSTRHILTEALLRLEAAAGEGAQKLPVEDIVAALEKVNAQLVHLQQAGWRASLSPVAQQASLEDAFVQSVRQAARPGITRDG